MNSPDNPRWQRLQFQLRSEGLPKDPPNPLRTGIHTRGYLPHAKVEGAEYFVTFRLIDSLPRDVLHRFLREREAALRGLPAQARLADKQRVDRQHRQRIERYLDRGSGACYLRDSRVAQLSAEALQHFDGVRYRLGEWVIMPNHVHLIIWPMPGFTLSEILRSRKRRIAREANLLLGRVGMPFWQPESYDHWIRNDRERERIGDYIRMNPVEAGLCRSPERWRWSSWSMA